MGDVEILVVDDPTEAAAQRIADAVDAGGNVGLSGGSGPRPAYGRVAELRPDWGGVQLWWIDERCVPPGDDNSNYRLVRESLIDRLDSGPEIHRVQGELTPGEAADIYDAELEGVTLDFALMGIGPDGHTASLFPNAPSLEVTTRRAIAAEPGMDPYIARVTMTRPVLAAARTMVYLVTGEKKADAVRRAFAEEPSPATPSSLVRGEQTVAILDRAAAALLPGQ